MRKNKNMGYSIPAKQVELFIEFVGGTSDKNELNIFDLPQSRKY